MDHKEIIDNLKNMPGMYSHSEKELAELVKIINEASIALGRTMRETLNSINALCNSFNKSPSFEELKMKLGTNDSIYENEFIQSKITKSNNEIRDKQWSNNKMRLK